MPLQVRRGPTADRILITPAEGELVLDTTENTLYVGDGTTPGGVAASSFTFEDAQDAAASLLTSGAHSNISFTYNDSANRIDAALNLRNYNGVIEADGFQGSLYSDDSTLLIDGVLGSVNLDGTIRSNLIPVADEVYDIGSPTHKFRDLYLSGSSLFLGDAQITASGSVINLPAGSTVNGTPIGGGTGDGVVEGSNYRINIVGDDSTVIIDSSSGAVNAVGGLTGDLTGSVLSLDGSTLIVNSFNDSVNAPGGVFGDVTGNLVGNVTGNVTGDLTGSVLSLDGSTLIVNSFNDSVNAPGGVFGDVTGNVTGNVVGDISGNFGTLTNLTTRNIFGEDSSTIIINNAVVIESNLEVNGDILTNQRIVGDLTGSILTGSGKLIYSLQDDFFNIKRVNVLPDEDNPLRATIAVGNSEVTGETVFRVSSNKQKGDLRLRYIDTSTTISSSTVLGALVFEKEDATGIVGYSVLRSRPSSFSIQTSDEAGELTTSRMIRLTQEGRVGIGQATPVYKLDVAGDTRITLGLTVEGSVTSGSFVQFGSLTTTQRNALTAVNGMVIYNTTANRFEGYQNSAWINLDDGTAAAV